jgi:hypothetical protein
MHSVDVHMSQRLQGPRRSSHPARDESSDVSPYFVSHEEIGDGGWHTVEIDFDFTKIPTAAYSIFDPHVNEGYPRRSGGKLLIRSVRLLSSP